MSNAFYTTEEAFNAVAGYVGELSPLHLNRFWMHVKRTPSLDAALLIENHDVLLPELRDFIADSQMLAEEVASRFANWKAVKQVQWCDDFDDDLMSWQRMDLLDRVEHEPMPQREY